MTTRQQEEAAWRLILPSRIVLDSGLAFGAPE